MASPSSRLEGLVIAGRYRVDAILAEGGMGIVYRGWHLVLDQPIAIKVVRPEYTHYPMVAARFLDEARTIARLRGPHVAHVLDSGRIRNGPPFMILELLDGVDLRALLQQQGPLPVERAVRYVLQACDAVREAHSHGIIHRDLKPENLFLARNEPRGSEFGGTIKVLDFGISKRMNRDDGRAYTGQGESVGSPHYMAPEQMSGAEDLDPRCDVWALGVVLFELLTGKVPFSGDHLPEICAAVLRAEMLSLTVLRSDIPVELEQVIRRCLSKDRAGRFASAEELVRALAPFAGSENPTLGIATFATAGATRLTGASLAAPNLATTSATNAGLALAQADSVSTRPLTMAPFMDRVKGTVVPTLSALVSGALAAVLAFFALPVTKPASEPLRPIAAAVSPVRSTLVSLPGSGESAVQSTSLAAPRIVAVPAASSPAVPARFTRGPVSSSVASRAMPAVAPRRTATPARPTLTLLLKPLAARPGSLSEPRGPAPDAGELLAPYSRLSRAPSASSHSSSSHAAPSRQPSAR